MVGDTGVMNKGTTGSHGAPYGRSRGASEIRGALWFAHCPAGLRAEVRGKPAPWTGSRVSRWLPFSQATQAGVGGDSTRNGRGRWGAAGVEHEEGQDDGSAGWGDDGSAGWEDKERLTATSTGSEAEATGRACGQVGRRRGQMGQGSKCRGHGHRAPGSPGPGPATQGGVGGALPHAWSPGKQRRSPGTQAWATVQGMLGQGGRGAVPRVGGPSARLRPPEATANRGRQRGAPSAACSSVTHWSAWEWSLHSSLCPAAGLEKERLRSLSHHDLAGKTVERKRGGKEQERKKKEKPG